MAIGAIRTTRLLRRAVLVRLCDCQKSELDAFGNRSLCWATYATDCQIRAQVLTVRRTAELVGITETFYDPPRQMPEMSLLSPVLREAQ